MSLAVAAAALAVLPARAADSTGHQNFSWVDKNGERHYGDAVPPEYAQSERRGVDNPSGARQRARGGEKAPPLPPQRPPHHKLPARGGHHRFPTATSTTSTTIKRLPH